MPRRPIQILLVAAHPADSFDQAGGTPAHHVARGDRVTVAIATTGCDRTMHELDQIDEPIARHMGRRGEMTAAFLTLATGAGFSSEHRVPKEKYGDA